VSRKLGLFEKSDDLLVTRQRIMYLKMLETKYFGFHFSVKANANLYIKRFEQKQFSNLSS